MKMALYIFLALLVIIALAIVIFLQQPRFGKLPEGDELRVIKASPHYQDGEFKNPQDTPLFSTDQSFASVLWDNLKNPGQRLRPESDMPVADVDFFTLNPDQDLVIWLGHSSYYVQLAGKRFLIDPIFSQDASPLPGVNRAFAGTTVFSAEDFPAIDYLLISHDHYDHLDYPTVMALKDKVSMVFAGLGIGSMFRDWGYDPQKIVEGDWGQNVALTDSLTLYFAPARHYSGRALKRNQTLWLGFILESSERRLLFSGDSGYGPHFAKLGQRFGGFDLVALDLGQYDQRWAYIHMTPEEAATAAEELGTKLLLPAHVGRFTLAKHAWDEPFQRITAASAGQSYSLVTPMIGEAIYFPAPSTETYSAWWQTVESIDDISATTISPNLNSSN